MSNLVEIKVGKVAAQDEIVERLENLLERAQSGEFMAFSYVFVDTEGGTVTNGNVTNSQDFKLIAGLEIQKIKILRGLVTV